LRFEFSAAVIGGGIDLDAAIWASELSRQLRENRLDYRAPFPASGTLDQEIFQKKFSFASRQRIIAVAAGNLAIGHRRYRGFDFDESIFCATMGTGKR